MNTAFLFHLPITVTMNLSARPQRPPLRLIIDSSLPHDYSSTCPESASSPISDSGLTTSGVTPSTGSPEWFICNVICMFDFESDDPHHLSFSRNEILTIVKMEESGWWAAMRPRGDRLGWIPSSFVERLTESATELDKRDDDTRIHDLGASNTRIPEADTDSDGMQFEESFTSGLDVAKCPPPSGYQLARGGLQVARRNSILYDSFFNLSDDEPSPNPPSHPSLLPAMSQPGSGVHSLTKTLDTLDVHSSSAQNFSIDSERSLPSSPYPRRPRRLAVLVNDSDSLSRLSALIDQGSSSAFQAIDSRRVKDTFDAFSKTHTEEEPLFLSQVLRWDRA